MCHYFSSGTGYHELLESKYDDVEKAIEKGDEKAKTKLAWLKLSGRGGAERDEDGAVALLEERVKDGDGEAIWMLGVCYEYGLGIEQNVRLAESLYKKSSSGYNETGRYFYTHRRDNGVMIINSLLQKQQGFVRLETINVTL